MSEDYIAQRVSEGKGKYISPDNNIDASTCSYPDYTWFVKGSSHSNWSFIENALLMEVVVADKQITVDDTKYSQFMVYDYDTDTMEAMDDQNCDKVYFDADKEYDKPDALFSKIKAFIKSLAKLMTSIFEIIKGKNSAGA